MTAVKEHSRPGPLGLRLPEDVKMQLEAEAALNERSLHGEIVHRLTASVRPETRRAYALAMISDILLSEISAFSVQRSAKAFLGMYREAVCTALAELDASPSIDDAQRKLAQAIGSHFARRVLSASEPGAALESLAPGGARQAKQFVRIREAIQPQTATHRASIAATRARKGKGESNA